MQYVVGVRNDMDHNYKIVYCGNKVAAKILSVIVKPFFNQVDVSPAKNITIYESELVPIADQVKNKHN